MGWWKEDTSEVARVVRVLVKHTIYVAVAVLCMRVLETLIEILFGEEKAFNLVPMGWPFLAGDLGMAARFYYLAAQEVQTILRGSKTDALPRTK